MIITGWFGALMWWILPRVMCEVRHCYGSVILTDAGEKVVVCLSSDTVPLVPCARVDSDGTHFVASLNFSSAKKAGVVLPGTEFVFGCCRVGGLVVGRFWNVRLPPLPPVPEKAQGQAIS
jgi:hypothetical protein